MLHRQTPWLLAPFILTLGCGSEPTSGGDAGSPLDAAGAEASSPDGSPADGSPSDSSVSDSIAPPSTGCVPAPTSPLVANVQDAKYGAKGDGVADDTAAIQAAVNYIAGTGGTVSIPSGTYMINVLVSIQMKSDMTLRLDAGAVLKAIPTSSANYDVVRFNGASNANVVGGAIVGERGAHTGTGGEWGMCLSVHNSQHIVVQGVTAKECWGDGFYVTDAASDVTLCQVIADHNRRQGMSITSVNGLVVRDSTFKNTTGTLPEDGIDIEPNAGETVNNAVFSNCTLADNAGFGFELGVPLTNTGKAFVTGVVFEGNTCSGNGVGTLSSSPRAGIESSNTSGHTIKNNTTTNNLGDGILLRDNANQLTVTGNTVTGNGQNGVEIYSCSADTVTGNTVTNNTGHGIITSSCTNCTISGNTVSGNGLSP